MQKSIDSTLVDQSLITSAADHLRTGELVAFPTETVYGLGADASNENALRNLYATKSRPASHPVIIHLSSAEQITDWAIDLSDHAQTLARYFWPGPLTLIVKKQPHVSPLLTGGQSTVGLRIPAHPVALALLKSFAGGIAAPSANKYGRISSTCAQHVRDEFGDEVKFVIDGGDCPVGIESTIVDTTSSVPKILRPGMISEKEIFDCLGLNGAPSSSVTDQSPDREQYIRVPGSDKTHYAPQTPMLLLNKEAIETTLSMEKQGTLFSILAFTQPDLEDSGAKFSIRQFIQARPDSKSYAHDLYDNLHRLDRSGADNILVETVPESSEWLAIADRLRRASSKA